MGRGEGRGLFLVLRLASAGGTLGGTATLQNGLYRWRLWFPPKTQPKKNPDGRAPGQAPTRR
jgi:hypothetical protein